MKKRNIPIWASKTSRGGHIYLRAENGEVENIIIINDDITKKVAAEQALKESEQRWSSLIENMPNIVTIVDLEMNISVCLEKLQFQTLSNRQYYQAPCHLSAN